MNSRYYFKALDPPGDSKVALDDLELVVLSDELHVEWSRYNQRLENITQIINFSVLSFMKHIVIKANWFQYCPF